MIAELRCGNCDKKLGENLQGRVDIVCPRCKHYNVFISHDYQSHKLAILENSGCAIIEGVD